LARTKALPTGTAEALSNSEAIRARLQQLQPSLHALYTHAATIGMQARGTVRSGEVAEAAEEVRRRVGHLEKGWAGDPQASRILTGAFVCCVAGDCVATMQYKAKLMVHVLTARAHRLTAWLSMVHDLTAWRTRAHGRTSMAYYGVPLLHSRDSITYVPLLAELVGVH